MSQRVLILGGDGYLGWPTAMHFSQLGHEVMVVDNLAKRQWEAEIDSAPLLAAPTLRHRVRAWHEATGKEIAVAIGDISENHRFVYDTFGDFQPDAVIHYAEQPSAPYSMAGRDRAVYTQHNNVVGTLNVIHAMMKHVPNAHLVKLGTMGEYGVPMRASSLMITRSAHSAMSLPPPTHQPCTSAITGLGERQIDMNLGIGPMLGALAITKSLPGSHSPSVVMPSSQWWNPPAKSKPAQNERPAPRSTITFTDSSATAA
jgi:NAD(P)-dependent dehydrogenase (short-subunit alcohol dehydrogenase family)